MENQDNIDLLFDTKDVSQLFKLDDEELQNLDKKVSESDKAITKFIDTKIHPKCRKKMKQLILQYSMNTGAYFHRENELLYKNGFSDCLNIVLTSLLNK